MKKKLEKQIILLFEEKSEMKFHDENIHIREIGLDSIQYIELLVAIEEEYSIEFEADKLFGSAFECLSDLIEYVSAKVCEAKETL